jgi:hypothetical protein
MALSPEVAAKLLDVAQALDDVSELWTDEDQATFDAEPEDSGIKRAIVVSLDEMVAAILQWVGDNEGDA